VQLNVFLIATAAVPCDELNNVWQLLMLAVSCLQCSLCGCAVLSSLTGLARGLVQLLSHTGASSDGSSHCGAVLRINGVLLHLLPRVLYCTVVVAAVATYTFCSCCSRTLLAGNTGATAVVVLVRERATQMQCIPLSSVYLRSIESGLEHICTQYATDCACLAKCYLALFVNRRHAEGNIAKHSAKKQLAQQN
jgi:hypothetical protein